ncbi:MAG: N-6 DNA methylase [Edaphocola sp.]
MALSWNEIKDRALKFSKEWQGTENEEADAKPFLVEFFNVFGITSKRVSTFEHRVKKLDDKDGYIDLLWKGTILIEMKSKGKNLDKAFTQAKDYLHGLKDHELPKYILVSDFENFRVTDLEENKVIEFKLNDLVNNVQHFGYLLGYQKKVYKEQDPANIKAAELMGKLHDNLKAIGYEGHPLEVYLVRVLFLLFAEDTTIFNKQQFQEYIEQRTSEDGSDLASKLQELFQVLDTPEEKRFKNLDEQLADFPYVNGKLFEEILPTASFDGKMRQALLDCCYIDWSKISPAIFGSMFQSVMNPKERRNLGAHYTSETNILKLIKPLFLDELWKEFESVKTNKNKLPEFHKKLSSLKFLDPACGCGNFLVVTYRELRLLELEVIRALNKSGQGFLNVGDIIQIEVDQFYGIEYEEFPAQIAQVAMWLIDHQMNMQVSNEFGQYFVRLPLNKSAKIVHGDALETDWESVVAKNELSYIIGNPPFIGSKIMTQAQRNQIVKQFENVQGSGVLDYVTGWYVKAAKYLTRGHAPLPKGHALARGHAPLSAAPLPKTKVAFVSTNSIVQGEQTSILWGQMLNKYGIKIHFAHRTFKWSNEARGNAAVYCVIIGFANFDTANKTIFDYEDIKGIAHEIKAKNINPYLVDAKDVLIEKRTTPLCDVPEMIAGNVAYDYGYFVFTGEEMNDFLAKEPKSEKWFRKLIGGKELINGGMRFCLWLKDIQPNELREMKNVLSLVEKVKQERLNAKDKGTHRLADRAHQFRDLNNPDFFIAIPKTSSENRKYIPINFYGNEYIPSDSIRFVPDGTLFHFGILTSAMHMAWVKTVCGRLKSDFRYSKDIVYNNYPFPQNPSDKQVKTIEEKAQKVLGVRAEFPSSSLADLYNPLTMPPTLVKAHNELDKAVDLAYRQQAFTTEASRMEFLFDLYERYTADLFAKGKKSKQK